jgi:4-diphosphocytidyl-2-C-methyl-D-erythritol kinase
LKRKNSLQLEGNFDCSVQENLIFKAVEIFRRETGINYGWRIIVEKRIPAGAGLGGGSSNGATTLSALNTLCKNPLRPDQLVKLGLALGSDVPFFLAAPAACIGGRGDQIQPLVPRMDINMVIIYPGFTINTAAAYRWLNMKKLIHSGTFEPGVDAGNIIKMYRYKPVSLWKLENTFNVAIEERFPQISRLRRELKELGALYSGLSGSGSTVFAIFDRRSMAERAESILTDSYALVKNIQTLDKIPVGTLKYM